MTPNRDQPAATPRTPVQPQGQTKAPSQPQGGAGGDPIGLIKVVGALMGAVIVLTIVLLFVRRKFLSSVSEGNSQAGLFEELRRMKLEGQISEEEFNAAKAKLGARMKAGALGQTAQQGAGQAASHSNAKPTRTTAARPKKPPAQ